MPTICFSAYDSIIPNLDPSDCFEEVLYALRGNNKSLPSADETSVGGGKIPGCSSSIQFNASTGELAIKWHSAGSGLEFGKYSLCFEPDETKVPNQRGNFSKDPHDSSPDATTVQTCFQNFARVLQEQVGFPPLIPK